MDTPRTVIRQPGHHLTSTAVRDALTKIIARRPEWADAKCYTFIGMDTQPVLWLGESMESGADARCLFGDDPKPKTLPPGPLPAGSILCRGLEPDEIVKAGDTFRDALDYEGAWLVIHPGSALIGLPASTEMGYIFQRPISQ